MSVWDWLHEFADEMRARGDRERFRLWEIQGEASRFGRAEPEHKLAKLEEGRALAQRLGESWWVLHFDHWRLQVLMHYLLDYRPEVLDLAVRSTLEARKPAYAHLPQRICLHEDLIYAYLGVDPLGHADAIRQALDYMRHEVSDDLECRYCVQNCRTEFALRRGALDEAEESARLTLQMADDEAMQSTADHHSTFAHCDLCEVAFRRQDWDTLAGLAETGEELARRAEQHLKVAEFLVWQAFLARRDRAEDRAARLLRQAFSWTRRVKSLPGKTFHDALCAFHELAGDLERALKVRDHELGNLEGKGRLHDECVCRIQRCRLLAQLGRPLAQELEAAREAARKLREPSPHLAELDRIAAG